MRLRSLAPVMAIIVLAVACSNCCLCIDYFAPPMQWYNYSCDAAPNVTLTMDVYTLGPQPITFLDSSSDKINFSSYGPFLSPWIDTRMNDSQLEIYFRMTGSSDIRPGVKADTYVYLPRGPNYMVFVSSIGNYLNESQVTNSYTGGNLTIIVNDHERMPPHFSGATLTPVKE